MIPVLILVISVAALAQFFFSYCRSLVSVYSKLEISREAMEGAHLPEGEVAAEEFSRLLALVQKSGVAADDSTDLGLARLYYLLLTVGQEAFKFLPSAYSWFYRERSCCAHMVGVALDRRIAYLRESA